MLEGRQLAPLHFDQAEEAHLLRLGLERGGPRADAAGEGGGECELQDLKARDGSFGS